MRGCRLYARVLQTNNPVQSTFIIIIIIIIIIIVIIIIIIIISIIIIVIILKSLHFWTIDPLIYLFLILALGCN